MPKKPTILFVDDESNVTRGIRRSLRALRDEWDTRTADSGPLALEVLEATHVDVVVSDMRMPGMDGAELLRRVATLYPSTVRVILSGQADQSSMARAMGSAHRFLSKPAATDDLVKIIRESIRLSDLLRDDHLRGLLTRLGSLPSLPAIYHELLEELGKGDPSTARIGEIIAKDVAMSAKILQVVNSVASGTRMRVSNPVQGVVYLGLEMIKALVLSVKVFSEYSGDQCLRFSIPQLQDHSLRSAGMSRSIAIAERLSNDEVDHIYAAAILHDIGTLILAANCPDELDDVMRRSGASGHARLELEREVFGATHADVGAFITSLWGLPHEVATAIRFHHTPEEAPDEYRTAASILVFTDELDDAIQDGAATDPDSLAARLSLPFEVPERWMETALEAHARLDSAVS